MANVNIQCLDTQIKFIIGPADCSNQDIVTIEKVTTKVEMNDGVLEFQDKDTGVIIVEANIQLAFTTLEIKNLDFPNNEAYFDFFNQCLLGDAVSPALTIIDTFFHVSSSVSTGDYDSENTSPAGSNTYTFNIPQDLNAIVSAVLVLVPDDTETGSIDIDTDYGSDGEDKASSSETDTLAGTVFVTDIIKEIDITSVLTGAISSDYVGLKLTNNLSTAVLRAIGVKLRYSSTNGLGGVSTWLGLSDTDNSYGGKDGFIPVLNEAQGKLILTDPLIALQSPFRIGGGVFSVELIGNDTNNADDDFSGVLSGDNNNITSTLGYNAIIWGKDNLISGLSGDIGLGGVGNITGPALYSGASAGTDVNRGSFAIGRGALLDRAATFLIGNGLVGLEGSKQHGVTPMGENTITAATDRFLRIQGTPDAVVNFGFPLSLTQDSVAVFKIMTSIIVSTGVNAGDIFYSIDEGCVKRVGGTTTLVELNNIQQFEDGGPNNVIVTGTFIIDVSLNLLRIRYQSNQGTELVKASCSVEFNEQRW